MMTMIRAATYSLNTHAKEMAATGALYRDAAGPLAIIVWPEWASMSLCKEVDRLEHLAKNLVITTAPRSKKRVPKERGGVAPSLHPLPPWQRPARPLFLLLWVPSQ